MKVSWLLGGKSDFSIIKLNLNSEWKKKKRLGSDTIPVVLVKDENVFGVYDSVCEVAVEIEITWCIWMV